MEKKFEVKDGWLTIQVPIKKEMSASGKTMLVYSSHGNVQTGVMFEDKELILSANVFYYASDSKQKKF